MSKKILIFSGDPNSINSEIIFKSWLNINDTLKKKIYIISNFRLIKDQFKKLRYKTKVIQVENINDKPQNNNIKILNIRLKFKDSFKISKNNRMDFVKRSLNLAHKLSLKDEIAGFINCPINKTLLGKEREGLTEFLAKKCKIKKFSEAMLISNERFSVCPITTHIDLKDVSRKINIKVIYEKIKTLHFWFKSRKGKKPNIGVLGLNPHNAELRKNSEERKIIIPALNRLKKENIKVTGPLSADTIFINNYKKYDVVVGMYHDQVITPFKTLFEFDAINITLGLKYLRVSPDHGTASNLVMKRKANPKSLIKCINFVNKFNK